MPEPYGASEPPESAYWHVGADYYTCAGRGYETRGRELEDTEAQCRSVLDDPHATEADRAEAAERLEETQTRMRELATALSPASPASFVGREVADARDGALLGPVETTEVLDYPPHEPVEALMVRHIHGDGQLRAYEPHEVREHIAEGRVIPPGTSIPQPEQEAEAEP